MSEVSGLFLAKNVIIHSWKLSLKKNLFLRLAFQIISTYWKRRAWRAVEDERSWWFGCSGTWVLQTLWYCDKWKILVQAISCLWKAKRSWCKNSIVFLAYSSLRMEANFWFWVCILDLAVLVLYPWMVLHSRWLWLSVTVATPAVLAWIFLPAEMPVFREVRVILSKNGKGCLGY